MLRKMRNILVELYYAHEENLGMILFSLVSYWIVSVFGPFKSELEIILGEDGVSVFYLATVYIAYLLWATVASYLHAKKIKLRSTYYDEASKKPPILGHTYYAGLEVEIPENWEITDCYVTIEKAVLIYGQNHVLMNEKFSTWFADKTKPIFKRLRPKSPYAGQDGKITIGDNSKKEIFCVGQINMGFSTIKSGDRKQEIPMRNFEFSLLSIPNTTIKFESFGLYQISLFFHWSSRGRKMPATHFDGYLYSNIEPDLSTGRFPVLILGEGDYRKDARIPAPLSEEVKHEEKAQPKNSRKKTGQQKKRKSSQKMTSSKL